MIHLIYGSRVYLNIDKARIIGVDNDKYSIGIEYDDESYFLDVCNHPKVKEILDNTREEEASIVKTQVCYKVLGVILERLANTDKEASPIINLEAGLATLQKAEPTEETKQADIIPVTVDKDGNITKVLKDKEDE